jgi:hypothetical protein
MTRISLSSLAASMLAAFAQAQTEKPQVFAYDQSRTWSTVLPTDPQTEPDRVYWTVMVHVRADAGPVAAAHQACN